MTPSQTSACCQSPVQVVRGYEGGSFLRCTKCGYAAEATTSNFFDMSEGLKKPLVDEAVKQANQMQQMVMMAAEIARMYKRLSDLGYPEKDATKNLEMYGRWVDRAYGKGEDEG